MKIGNHHISFFFPSLKHYESSITPEGNSCGTAAISITGSACALKCKHCGGTILKRMEPALTPQALKEQAHQLVQKGIRSILISGGSRPDGTVPLGNFLGAVKEIKRETGIKVLVHTGLVSQKLADRLADAGIDCAMIDIIGARETVREIYGLKAEVVDFENSLKWLTERNIPTAPHVVMGLHFGEMRGEKQALSMIAGYPVSALVLVGFRPIPGTAMAGVKPLSPEAMGELFVMTRELFPHTPVLLGCERPLGRHRVKTDQLAIEAGLDGIAYPGEEAINLVRENGITIRSYYDCCALIPPPFRGRGSR